MWIKGIQILQYSVLLNVTLPAQLLYIFNKSPCHNTHICKIIISCSIKIRHNLTAITERQNDRMKGNPYIT